MAVHDRADRAGRTLGPGACRGPPGSDETRSLKALSAARSVEEVRNEWMMQPRLRTQMAVVFGAAVLLLTIVGLWAARPCGRGIAGREWAIRQAVGAQPHEVVLAAVTEVVAVVGAGAIAGWSLFPVSAALVRTTIAGLPEADPRPSAQPSLCSWPVRSPACTCRPAGPGGSIRGDAASRVAPSARRYRPSKSSVARGSAVASARTAPCCRAGPPWDGTCVDRKSRGWRPIPDRLTLVYTPLLR